MTGPYPTPDVELHDMRFHVQIFEAITVAATDAHTVLDIVLSATDPDVAHRALADRFGFTDAQARAVMDLQFRGLTSAERDHIERRVCQLGRRIAVLERELGGA